MVSKYNFESIFSSDRDRTCDLAVNSRTLYRLSYRRIRGLFLYKVGWRSLSGFIGKVFYCRTGFIGKVFYCRTGFIGKVFYCRTGFIGKVFYCRTGFIGKVFYCRTGFIGKVFYAREVTYRKPCVLSSFVSNPNKILNFCSSEQLFILS